MPLEPTIYAILISFVIAMCLCPFAIPYLHKLKFGQYIRTDGPESHLKKGGTPTMGGIIILASFAVCACFFITGNSDGMMVTLATLAFGVIGFMDDYIKVVKKRNLGLRVFQKLALQLVVCALIAYYILVVRQIGTLVAVPFMGGYEFDLGYLYIPFLIIVVLGTVNAVNLTDGLDGLASGVTAMVAVFFCILAWVMQSGVSPIAGAIIGALLGFLLYNAHPARLFMGDTGSLALGGFVAASALVLKMPMFIVIVGIVYVVEALSVIIQVGYYKKTRRRVFKMAPIHHHLELSGFSETRVVAVFYIITAIACLIGYIASRGMY
jgi:phospho-N-acetylmuramoyl-pentapeptide-transferase